MAKHICLVFLTTFAFSAVPVLSLPPIPCPEVFRYSYNMIGEVEGEITVPFDFGDYLMLSVNASMRGYFGKQRSNMKIKMLTPGQDLFYKNNPWVKYQLIFPVQKSIPRITEIVLNGRIFCRGPPEPLRLPGPPVTSMYSTHSFHFSSAGSGGLVDSSRIPEGRDYKFY